MHPRTDKKQPAVAPKSVILRQMIVSTIALAIVGLGAWSLMGQTKPYHPEVYTDEVSRDGIFEWFGETQNN